MADAPESVDVPAASIGLVIGRGGSVIKRLIESTGCKIEVPRGRPGDDGPVAVQLAGTPGQRRQAASAIVDILNGGEAEDHAARAEGAMVITHDLKHFDRESWAQWRLVPVEKEHGAKTQVGRNAVRVWAVSGRMTGASAGSLRSAVEAALAEARELVELKVECRIDLDAENVNFDAAVAPLVDQYGVLVRVDRIENGVVPVRVVGPSEPARDAAVLIEARYAKGKATASVPQLPGQVQAMPEQMLKDFTGDVESLEQESRVKVTQTRTVLWIAGASRDTVNTARTTLRDMMQFYFPDDFLLRTGLKKSAIDRLRKDESLRVIQAKPDCVMSFDDAEGTAWLCGAGKMAAKERIDAVLGQWAVEHWEYDLEDYGVAMWLLGPRGSGDYLGRMKNESGAEIKVCPNNLKVWVDGKPGCVDAAKRLIMEGIQRLEEKKRTDAEEMANPKVKDLLGDHPSHMQSILMKLKELDEKQRLAQIAARRAEWAREAPAAPQPPAAAPAERQADGDTSAANGSAASAPGDVNWDQVPEWNPATGSMSGDNSEGRRERSRSRDRAPTQP